MLHKEVTRQFVMSQAHTHNEHILGQVWDRSNYSNSSGLMPLRIILHDIVPWMHAQHRIQNGDLYLGGFPYWKHDVRFLSQMISWLGSVRGTEILYPSSNAHEPGIYLSRWRARRAVYEEELARLLATPKRKVHQRHKSQLSRRERMLVDALMYWLGSTTGRRFLRMYEKYKKIHERFHALTQSHE